jgi:hypothetical protein
MIFYGLSILSIGAAFYCYMRLQHLTPMRDPARVTRANATITEVITPMVQKGQSTSDVVNQIRFRFEVDGHEVLGGYSLRDRSKAPEVGAVVLIVYLTARPSIFLQADAYASLPRQLMALRVMAVLFTVAAFALVIVGQSHS